MEAREGRLLCRHERVGGEEIRANGIRIPTNESRWVFKGI